MSRFFNGFSDELDKLAKFKIKKLDDSDAASFGKKKTFVPGMTQKQITSHQQRAASAPKVQQFTFKAPKKAKVPPAGQLRNKRMVKPPVVKPSSKPKKFDALDNLLKGIK